jgi:hypothetical protein
MTYSSEQVRHLDYLTLYPHGSTSMKRADLEAVIEGTRGKVTSRGSDYEIIGRDLGSGLYQVSLRLSASRWR